MGAERPYEQEEASLLDKLNAAKQKVTFLFGAGTSVVAGLPTMPGLTADVEALLEPAERDAYGKLRSHLKADEHIEHILNFLEQVNELNSFAAVLGGISTAMAQWTDLNAKLRTSICKVIKDKSRLDSIPHRQFANWLRSKDAETEVFTTNYDLLFEHAFESKNVLYFDGFTGGISPYFQPATVDPALYNVGKEIRPPDSWIRLWKMHGSINWVLETDDHKLRVRRRTSDENNCLIYPSKAKYSDSRRLPFIVLQDKFRRTLQNSNQRLVILGYGFGDEHLNEIIFDAIESNPRLDLIMLSFLNLDGSHPLMKIFARRLMNVTVFTPGFLHTQGDSFPWKGGHSCKLGDATYFFSRLEESINP